MRAPIRLVRGGWPMLVESRLSRFVREDPSPVVDGTADAEQFRRIMSLVHAGGTIKITGTGRHGLGDRLLLDHVELAGGTLVDLGASDGSTSLELLDRLPQLDHYVIADLFLHLRAQRTRRHLVLRDPDGTCVLVAGRRLVAWPQLSRTVRYAYRPVLRATRVGAAAGVAEQDVELLNPDVRRRIADDPRLSAVVHDVFTPWPAPAPDVVKVANLLRRLYFTDADILRGLRAIHAGLRADGHLLVVDNPRIAGIDERAGLYRRTRTGFAPVATTTHPAEIHDLVTTVTTVTTATTATGAPSALSEPAPDLGVT